MCNIKWEKTFPLESNRQIKINFDGGDLSSNVEAIKKPSIRESIIRNADRLRTNYKLIKLEGAVPLPFDMEELAYEYGGITTNEVLKGIGVK